MAALSLMQMSSAVNPTVSIPGFFVPPARCWWFPLPRSGNPEAVYDLLRALCLVLILEGIIPFLYPGRWRQMAAILAMTHERQLRLLGLTLMLTGLGFLYLLR